MSAFSVTVSPRSVSTIGACGSIARLTWAWYEPSVALTSSPNGRSAYMCGSTVLVPRLQPPAYGRSKTSERCSSGPRNMMIDRVRRAASSSMCARSSSLGGMISRSFSSPIQRVCTPRLLSTSSSRLTSSIRATLRSVVRPLLSSEAQSSATPAFLEVFTSMLPESVVGPETRRWVGPAPRATISESSAAPMRASISSERFWWPFSIRLMALWLVERSSASWACVSPRCLRASRMMLPILPL